jgi:hypothetical protein
MAASIARTEAQSLHVPNGTGLRHIFKPKECLCHGSTRGADTCAFIYKH